VRRGEAVADAFEDVRCTSVSPRLRRTRRRTMEAVESPPSSPVPVGQQVYVELGTDAFDEPRQGHGRITRREARRVQLVICSEKSCTQRHVVLWGTESS